MGKCFEYCEGPQNRGRCPECKKCISIRDGSFFSKSQLSLQRWLLLIHWWAWKFLVIDCAKALEVNENTSCAVYQWLREVCSTLLGMQIEMEGEIVQTDKSLFCHKPKVCTPPKFQLKGYAYNHILFNQPFHLIDVKPPFHFNFWTKQVLNILTMSGLKSACGWWRHALIAK